MSDNSLIPPHRRVDPQPWQPPVAAVAAPEAVPVAPAAKPAKKAAKRSGKA